MKAIYKYEIQLHQLGPDGGVDLELPTGAEILSVRAQDMATINFWVLIESDNPDENRRIVVKVTGHDLTNTNLKYLGTVFSDPFVWHVFEKIKEELMEGRDRQADIKTIALAMLDALDVNSDRGYDGKRPWGNDPINDIIGEILKIPHEWDSDEADEIVEYVEELYYDEVVPWMKKVIGAA